MNKIEKHQYGIIMAEQYVKEHIKVGMWCRVQEMIDNPEIFPLQPETRNWMLASERRRWAEMAQDLRQVYIFVSRILSDGTFTLECKNVPPKNSDKHINKLWRKAYESV